MYITHYSYIINKMGCTISSYTSWSLFLLHPHENHRGHGRVGPSASPSQDRALGGEKERIFRRGWVRDGWSRIILRMIDIPFKYPFKYDFPWNKPSILGYPILWLFFDTYTYDYYIPSGKWTVRPWQLSGLEDSFPLKMGDFQGLC